ncbi:MULTISPECIES: CoA pyrophosphatase [Hydrogenophaga]|jgi:8-oxo-dGTP pyrophosphatase MutT (NUDIX family)|uniref:NUDIX hydrolase n=1 Tax=Hydrogenophaga intermedia TaxID=65786 RepID=A0A1L1PFQ3_HYDIT|nr:MULTISPECIES: CoA pyrophosphatase [Hydrogenophaga]AOS78214.1 coenzyme A pyrophosphatase [Hydrogenophaga sp. PBC]TMU76413.1 CoA pyrophosphatase [Hydrogenophaga intermedia]CDN87574.1 NUDIX hydrolase [Hydrogenophaga intermedia]
MTEPVVHIPPFDPRTVPVVATGTSEGLAPAAAHRLTPDGLRSLFEAPPIWTPEFVRERRFADREPADAAVLLPLVVRDELKLLLTQRTSTLSTHSGQIAFPGGKVDPEDADAVAAALREAHEEIGLPAQNVEVLGTLPVYITGTAFHVTPVVALVQPGFVLQPNPHEVDDVFEVPLGFLMDPRHHRRHLMNLNGTVREWYSMPWHDGQHERFIWGATAGMLRNLYRLLTA